MTVDVVVHTSNEPKGTGVDHSVVLVPQPSTDPRDPLNWKLRKKAFILFILCFAGFSALALPSSQQLTYFIQTSAYTGVTAVEMSYSVTVCVAGEVGGPFIFWPLADKMGRSSLILWSLIVGFICQIWAARMTGSNDYVSFMLSRVVAGMAASIPTVLGPSYAVDIFFLHQRGRVFAFFELAFLLGVNVAPTVSGFIVNNASWTWAYWWTLVPCGVAIVLVILFLEETGGYSAHYGCTYPDQPRSFLKNRIATFFPGHLVIPNTSWRQISRKAAKPFVILVAPITLLAGGYIFIVFSFVILANIMLTIILEEPLSEGGYAFTPMRNAAFTLDAWFAIGVAQIVGWLVSDRIPLWASRRFGKGVWHPEYRLYNILLPGLVGPIGLGIFGAGVQYHLHYMVLAVGFFLIVFSSMLSVPICLNYIVECYKDNATEAAIAMNFWRLSFAIATGFIFSPWMEAVGVGWLFGMAAFFDLFGLIMVMVLIWKGPLLRSFSPMLSSEEGIKIAEMKSSTPSASASLSGVENDGIVESPTVVGV